MKKAPAVWLKPEDGGVLLLAGEPLGAGRVAATKNGSGLVVLSLGGLARRPAVAPVGAVDAVELSFHTRCSLGHC